MRPTTPPTARLPPLPRAGATSVRRRAQARRRKGRRAGQAASGDVPRGKPSVLAPPRRDRPRPRRHRWRRRRRLQGPPPGRRGLPRVQRLPGPRHGRGPRDHRRRVPAARAIAQTLADHDVVKSSKAFVDAANNDPKSAGIQPGIYDDEEADEGVRRPRAPRRPQEPPRSPASSSPRDCGRARSTRSCRRPPASRWRSTSRRPSRSTSSACRRRPRATSRATSSRPATSSAPPRRPSTSSSRWSPSRRSGSRRSASHPTAWSASSRSRASSRGRPRTRPTARRSPGSSRTGSRPKMSLGFDSTVNYIFKKRGVPTQEMLDSNSPYNTRRFPGLPPGPIANPGESALRAAASPAAGPWLYFVTVNLDTGETKFAATYAEHQAQRRAVPAVVQADQGQVLTSAPRRPTCAVWGSPIAHSLSPVLHRAAYAALGLHDWSYDRREVDASGVRRRPRRARRRRWRGLSLTMPLKEVALAAAARRRRGRARPPARPTPSSRPTAGWHAHNTDVHGIDDRAARGADAPTPPRRSSSAAGPRPALPSLPSRRRARGG